MPSLPEMKAVHAQTLDLLKYFDGLCRDCGARYTLHGGTLLGAIREGGFIPWDDDADVSMMRAEYEKLRDRCRRGPLPEHMIFSEYSAQHPRMWLRRPGQPGAWIDLFILDYISENPVAAKMKLLGCAFFLAFTKNRQSLEVSFKAGQHRGLGNVLMTFGYLLGKPFSPQTKSRMQNAFLKHAFPGRRTRIHRGNDVYSYIGATLPAAVMAEYQDVPFEDTTLMMTSRWHDSLVSSYGEDYMTPKRVSAHLNPAHVGFTDSKEQS